MSSKEPFLSVVIPAYNEAHRVPQTLLAIQEYLESQGYPYEIIVVDDGSRDATGAALEKISARVKTLRVLKNHQNQGKGYAVKRGVLQARGNYVLFSDADLSTPIGEVEKLLSWLHRGYDIAIASRGSKESQIQVHQPWYRERMGKIFNLLVRLVALRGITDTQCGFKCFRKDCIAPIFNRQRIKHFAFDVELLYLANKLGYKIKEVPVVWVNDRYSRVNPIKDSIVMLIDLLRIRFDDLLGKYTQEIPHDDCREANTVTEKATSPSK